MKPNRKRAYCKPKNLCERFIFVPFVDEDNCEYNLLPQSNISDIYIQTLYIIQRIDFAKMCCRKIVYEGNIVKIYRCENKLVWNYLQFVGVSQHNQIAGISVWQIQTSMNLHTRLCILFNYRVRKSGISNTDCSMKSDQIGLLLKRVF